MLAELAGKPLKAAVLAQEAIKAVGL